MTPRMANGISGAIMPLYIPPEPFAVTVHGSIRDPPHERLISPTGTSRSLRRRAPKWYSTAEKFAAEAGVEACHDALTSLSGAFFCTRGTLNRRTFGWLAAAMFCLALCEARSDHCMFDWPDPTHTSPRRMS